MASLVFQVLGPLAVWTGRPVVVAGPKRRALLALLLSRRNQLVGLDRICEELWWADPPSSAVANIRNYVSSIRALLADHGDRLRTGNAAYGISVRDDELDEARFDAQAASAAAAAQAGQLDRAMVLFESALALWRGEALAGVEGRRAVRAYADALTEKHVSTRQHYLEACLRGGRIEVALQGMRRLVAEYPTNEEGWYALVNARYAVGDRAGALRALQDARTALAEHLGLEPGPQLRTLQRQILHGRPPEPPATLPRKVSCSRAEPLIVRQPRPAQLPRRPHPVIGRDPELDLVTRALRRGSLAPAGAVVMISGLGGVGKTTLALAAAHEVSEHFPDGQLFVDLRGSSVLAPQQPLDVLRHFLRALGIGGRQLADDLESSAPSFQNAVAGRRLLIVLDNAHDPGQLRHLLPAEPGCATIITSRRPLDALNCTDRVHLSTLTPQAAAETMRSLVGGDRVDREPAAFHAIARLCGHLPLALVIIGLRMARHPGLSAADVALALREERTRLDHLGFADLDVRSTFQAGYDSLVKDSPVAERAALMFRRIGAGRFHELTPEVAGALIGVRPPETERVLDALIDYGLVEPRNGRYVVHDLIRSFAIELAVTESPEATRAAVRRAAQTYIRIVRRSPVLFQDGEAFPRRAGDAGCGGPRSSDQALTWLDRHRHTLKRLIEDLVADDAPGDESIALAHELIGPLSSWLSTTSPADCVELYAPLLARAFRTKDPVHLTQMYAVAIFTEVLLDRPARLETLIAEASSRLDEIGSSLLRAQVVANIALARVRLGQPEPAITAFDQAITAYLAAGRWRAVAKCLLNASEATRALDLTDGSLALLRHSLLLARRHDLPELLPWILDSLGMVRTRTGHERLALLHLDRAVRESEQRSEQSVVPRIEALQRRALVLARRRHFDRATADARRSVAETASLGWPVKHRDALRALGAVQWLAGDPASSAAFAQADAITPPR